MKKLFAIVLAVLTVLSFSTVAFAADTTTLTTTVPDATYTLNIPADQEITFGATSTDIGIPTVTDSSGFAPGKNLKVTVEYTDFICADTNTTIPFVIYADYLNDGAKKTIIIPTDGNSIYFNGLSNGKASEKSIHPESLYWNYYLEEFNVSIEGTDWGKALGGEYTSTITFTAEVVAEV